MHMEGLALPSTACGNRPSPRPSGVPLWYSVGALYGPPPTPSAPPLPRPPAASTVSSPPLPINYLSFPTSPPSLASLSSSTLASASYLLRLTPPPCQVQTTVHVAQRGVSTGGGRWPPPRPRVYAPPTYKIVKKHEF